MLRRVYRPAKSLTCLHARSYTANPTSVYPYKKLRAFPFVMPPETAQRRMANHAQRLCGGRYFLRTTFLDLFPDTWDIKFKRPISFAAVYFPAWLISGTMFSKVIFDEAKDLTLFFFSKITYLPGCDLSTMSTPVLWNYGLSDIEPVPLTENLLTQHDLRVNCVPFNTSPFSVLDLCSSVSEDGFSLKPGVKIIPHIVDDFVAMPVLLPLYVATYADENHDSGDVLTMYIQAHSNDGNIKADQDQLLRFLKRKDNKEPIEVYPTVEGQEVCNIDHAVWRAEGLLKHVRTPSAVGLGVKGTEVDAYLSRMLGSSENIRKLALMGSLETDEDPRIREMTAEEIKKRNTWFSSREPGVDRMVDGINRDHAAKEAAAQAAIDKNRSKTTNTWARYAKLSNSSSLPPPPLASAKPTTGKKKKPGKGK